jgi:hypothetical protein
MFLDKPRDLWRDRNSRLGARTSYARTSDDRKKGEQFKLVSQHLFAVFACPWRLQFRPKSEGAIECQSFRRQLSYRIRVVGFGDGVGVPARIRQSRKIFPSIFPSKRSFPSDRDLARRNQMASPFTLDYATIRPKSERALWSQRRA